MPSPFGDQLFPVNVPAWSLFLELVANLVMALLVLRRTASRLTLWVGVSGLALVWAAMNLSARAAAGAANAEYVVDPFSAGWGWQGLEVGLLRTAFSFACGMLIADQFHGKPRRLSALALPLWAVILLVLAMPVQPSLALWFAAAVVLVVSPVLVLSASRVEPPEAFRGAAMWIGDISFALYAVHAPVAGLFRKLGELQLAPGAVIDALYLLTVVALATAAHRWFDLPVRRWLYPRLLGDKNT